jgi:hypothetical protein
VDGKESLGSALDDDEEGVFGVRRPVKSSSNARREGVLGNGTELVAANRVLEAEDLLDEGVYLRWESKSDRTEDAFTGVFDESDATLEAFVGDVGEGGVDRIFTEDGDLGEADANSCVSFEGLGERSIVVDQP